MWGGCPMTGSVKSGAVSTVTTVSDIITAASGFTVSSASVNIWGKVAQLTFNISKSTAVTTDTNLTIATVKSAYRPKATANGIANTSTIKVMTLGTNGEISTYGQWSAGTSRTLSFVYLLP